MYVHVYSFDYEYQFGATCHDPMIKIKLKNRILHLISVHRSPSPSPSPSLRFKPHKPNLFRICIPYVNFDVFTFFFWIREIGTQLWPPLYCTIINLTYLISDMTNVIVYVCLNCYHMKVRDVSRRMKLFTGIAHKSALHICIVHSKYTLRLDGFIITSRQSVTF